MSAIPVAERESPEFGRQFQTACEEIGFVAIRGHGIAPERFAEMRDLVVRLFGADDAAKQAGAVTRDDYRGFIPFGFFTPNRPEVDGADAAGYEGFKLHWECPAGHPAAAECALYGPNRWPAHVPDMADVIGRYWAACDALAAALLDVIAVDLGVDPRRFADWFEAPLTNMTLLHYPARRPGAAPAFHPHKDTNVFTFLAPDPARGLELRTREGEWVAAEYPADAVLVNIGEMLELWSGGRYVATPHRVVGPAQRWSFPWFLVPNHAVVVQPLVGCVEGFRRAPMPVGALSAEVWRTNWPDEAPSAAGHDLGTLGR